MPLPPVNRERAPWFGAAFDYVVAGLRDAFGVPLEDGATVTGLGCAPRTGLVEVARAGGTASRQDGLTLEAAWQDFFAVGGQVLFAGARWSVVGLDAKPDYKGRRRYAVLRCLARAGGA